MAKIRLDLTDVQRCSKRGCKHEGMMHRHHTRHQWMFVVAFRITRPKQKKYIRFARSYARFNKRDVELLCIGHHGEIHELYDVIVINHCFRRVKKLQDFTWPEANRLMAALHKKYLKWKDIETKISNPPTTRIKGYTHD